MGPSTGVFDVGGQRLVTPPIRGLDGQLLFDADQRVLAATRTVAARYFVVDAIDDTAVGFYEHYGFTRSPGEPSMRLIRKLGDIQADVDFRS